MSKHHWVNPDNKQKHINKHKKIIPPDRLRVLSVEFLDTTGQSLPVEGGFVQLAPVTRVRFTFSHPVGEVFIFLTPTGTGTFPLTRLIAAIPVSAERVVDFVWQVPEGTLGFLFVIGCDGRICARSVDFGVVRE